MNVPRMDDFKDAVIGIPTYRHVEPQAYRAVFELTNEFGLKVLCCDSFEVASNREWIVEQAVKAGFKRLLFLDSDTAVQPAGVIRIFDTLTKTRAAMIAALVPRRPGRDAGYNAVLGDDVDNRLFAVTDIPQTFSAVPVHFVGLAVAALDLKAVGAVPGPRFARTAQGFTHIGEDLYFCRWLRNHDLDFYVDPGVRTQHICPVPLTHDPQQIEAMRERRPSPQPLIVAP